MLTSTFLLSFTFIRSSVAGYTLIDGYTPSNFFDGFNFFDGKDPTDGFVKFVNRQAAESSALISTAADSVKFGVDSTSVTKDGRMSIRIESKKSYSTGLIIADIAHMPGSICGTWPAFWTIGPDWPANGEIDIIEGVNSQSMNSMTLHTRPGCSISSQGKFSGKVKTKNCDINAPGQGMNVGCGISAGDVSTYGDGFNNAGGGIYATEWTAEAITIHHFERSKIPADIQSGNPDPASWGAPLAVFSGCNFPDVIRNQTIIFDTTFCGQWAGQQSVWESDPVCSKKAATCQDYVSNNPADFAQAFWQVNSVKVYQLGDGFIGSSPVPPPVSTPSATPLPAPSSTKDGAPSTFVTSASSLPEPINPSSRGRFTSYEIVTVDMTTTLTVDTPAATPAYCAQSRQGCISKAKGDWAADAASRGHRGSPRSRS
ncbi:hypothetical protein EJ08DRAFT_285652 [Tothia fuscella]|uniref:endo-1,3(4)-beta-glucanase n=1 Tax=Tothia fuscella TaxID=1048955 RepID=A0A9P4U397_9PEZI|nr:hypothetical protein EJ08DRAFT_285652 [Tothia fuscella]